MGRRHECRGDHDNGRRLTFYDVAHVGLPLDAPALTHMRILQKGNRLSITPIDPKEWDFILSIL